MSVKERLKEFIKSENLTPTAFEKRIGASNGYVNSITKGIGKEKMESIIENFPNIDVRWILYGDDSNSTRSFTKEKQLKKNGLKPLQEVYETEDGKPIPYIEAEVLAGISPGFNDAIALRPEVFKYIPMFARGEFAIMVTGNSMKGYINHGDFAVIRQITDIHSIIYGEPYVIITKTNYQRTVKFLNEHEDESKLWLSSYNIEQFKSRPLDKDEILEVWEVVGILRKFG